MLAVTHKHKSLADGFVSDFRNSRSAIKAREDDVCFGSGKQKIVEVFPSCRRVVVNQPRFRPPLESVSVRRVET